MLEPSIRLARLLSQKSLYSDAGAKPLRGYGDGYARRRHRIIHIVIQQRLKIRYLRFMILSNDKIVSIKRHIKRNTN